MSGETRLPHWLVKPISDPSAVRRVKETLATCRLNTVCDEARCPNRVDCFSRGTATFMILGDTCTRDCRFCAVRHGTPVEPDPDEPRRVAAGASALDLRFVVLTSVTRDDLPDGGAAHFAETVKAVRKALPDSGIEVLVPDFEGRLRDVATVLEAAPDVFGHNIETVRKLYGPVRSGADYDRSLAVLREASSSGGARHVKSAIMLGLGEDRSEIREALSDLRSAGADVAYLGQYLRPTRAHAPVKRFVPPEEFEEIREEALSLGFAYVSAGPFVRSSYEAERVLEQPARPGAAGGRARTGGASRR